MWDFSADILGIGNAFLAAPMEENGWDSALKLLAEGTGSARGQLVAFGHDKAVPFNAVTDVPNGWLEEFIRMDGANPRINWRIASAGAPFEVGFEHHYAAARSRLRSEAYDEFAFRHDMMDGCQTVLSNDDGVLFGLATLRTRQDKQTTEAQRSTFAQVAPFALAAIKLQMSLDHKVGQLTADTLTALEAIAFILDDKSCVLGMTGRAEDFLNGPSPLRLDRGFLRAVGRKENALLQRNLASILDPGTCFPKHQWLKDEAGLARYNCGLFQLPERAFGFRHRSKAVLVVRDLRGSDLSRATHHVVDALGLTTAEAAVALQIGQGASREEIALRRGTTVGTVHAQLNSIFRKADVSRQSELAALVARITAG